MKRFLRLAAAGLMLAALAGDAEAGFLDGLIGGSVFKTFHGKFIESKTVQTAAATPPKTTAEILSFSGSGRLIGSSVWDSIPSPLLTAYANGILQKLLAGWSGPHQTIRLWVTANPGLEANSTGAGDIFLARGWFESCQNEDQVAAIIAHEASHILLNHFAREEANEGRRRAVAGAATAAVTAFTLSSTRVSTAGNQVKLSIADQKKLNDNVQKTLLIKFAINEISSFAFNSAWAREQEEEADLLGMDLLYRAKYNVPQMAESLKLMKQYETQSEAEVDVLSDEYKTAMTAAMLTGNVDTMKATGVNILTAELLKGADRLRSRLNRDHPDIDGRIKAVQGYIAREYEDDTGGKTHPTELLTFREGKGVKAIFVNHKSSLDAMAALVKSDFGQAKPLAARGASGATAAFPYPLRIRALTEQKSGNAAAGLKTMERAAASPDASFDTLMLLTGMYSDAGNYTRAHATLATAAERFGSVEATYPGQIQLALKEGKKPQAEALLKTCSAVKNADLVSECRGAMGEKCSGPEVLCALGDSNNEVGDVLKGLFDHAP